MNTALYRALYRAYPEGSIREKRRPARDKMVIAAEKAYRASNQYQLDKLINLERRYATRLGMAQAGLRKTRKQIQALLVRLSAEKMGEAFK